jgi:RND superfamily putative drug exporter
LTVLISIPAIYISLTGATSYDFAAGLANAESVHGLTVLEQSFGAGQIGPTQVLLQFPATILANGNLTKGAQANLENLSQKIAGLSNVKEVTGPTRPDGVAVDATNMAGLAPQQRLAILGDIGKDNRTAMVTALFVDEPFTQNSLNTVSQIRSLVTSLQSSDASLARDTILVGGASASTLDFANDTVNQFNTMRVLTVAAIFVVLLVVLGSYPLAITGILSIGLSITWAYAATLLFFNNVLQSGVLFIIPLILFLLLYGIGMDYNIFILTRIREEAQKGKETRQAVVDAVDRTGGIITALALILAGALGSLLLSSNRLLEGFGFAIALAVVLDAMVVRTYLVPAIMSVLGQRAWWGPNRLRRVRFEKREKTQSVNP